MITRRSMLLGLGAALTTPAIVRAESLMRVVMPVQPDNKWAPELIDAIVATMMQCHAADLNAAVLGSMLYGQAVWQTESDGIPHHVPLAEIHPVRYADGTITLDRPVTDIEIGIPYRSIDRPKNYRVIT